MKRFKRNTIKWLYIKKEMKFKTLKSNVKNFEAVHELYLHYTENILKYISKSRKSSTSTSMK